MPVLLHPNTNVTTGTLIGPDGSVLNKPTTLLSDDDARLLRTYKKFLQRMGWREATYCNACFEGNLSHDGMQVRVTDDQIVAICRHRMVYYGGQSY
ncbi:MAG TPA: hypothetical protein VGJ80_06325 [Gemmatimonadales bacterium]|jgi:hypothetical protein